MDKKTIAPEERLNGDPSDQQLREFLEEVRRLKEANPPGPGDVIVFSADTVSGDKRITLTKKPGRLETFREETHKPKAASASKKEAKKGPKT